LLKGLNILVAEDNLINQKIANYILTKQGAKVQNAVNGMEAVQMIENHTPIDIILMDLQMPGMDGIEAATRIRKDLGSNVPIIALTADLYANESQECAAAGINACIAKPFEPEALCDLILQLTGRKEQNTPILL